MKDDNGIWWFIKRTGIVNSITNLVVNNELSSVLLSKKITTDEIKENPTIKLLAHGQDSLDDKLMKEEYPPEFEGRHLFEEDSQFTKVRITYNKEFLPTRIEWYYKGEEGLQMVHLAYLFVSI